MSSYYAGLLSGANAEVSTPSVNASVFARPNAKISSSTVVTTTSSGGGGTNTGGIIEGQLPGGVLD